MTLHQHLNHLKSTLPKNVAVQQFWVGDKLVGNLCIRLGLVDGNLHTLIELPVNSELSLEAHVIAWTEDFNEIGKKFGALLPLFTTLNNKTNG